MIQTNKLRVIHAPEDPEAVKARREKIRERLDLLTVRNGTCGARWGSWGTWDGFDSYKDRRRD